MNKDGIEVRIGKSAFYFKLGNILDEKNISKNKLSQDTETDYKVITRYINGDLTRLDINILERLCNYLDCNISDIVELKKSIFK
ncbi:MAG TPA: helix-turn-helix transcriptional regulator [Candidatus Onthousia faecipullorum]|mgnify:CR=1 FL=1|uniref:Helix-turn-helix transcriptional regulator n=1 Tax=Candidatus Onthousia faecipullorum TaxID=2840887 RepID=A0A9D1GB89_9FIRM|nr:helix-turn-helix transcriptional regulator [Candidatus Onthousia faecipullorum]